MNFELIGFIINFIKGKDNIFTLIWSIGIVLYGLWGWFSSLSKIGSLNKELKKFIRKIEIIEDDFEGLENDVTPENLEKEKQKYLKNLDIDDNGVYLKDIVKKYFRTLKNKNFQGVKSSSFFNEEDIVINNFNLNKIEQRNSMFVGLGLLGTFSGIMYGLWKLGNTQTATAQVSLIDKILPSMSMAFMTSIFGMLCSLLYGHSQKSRLGEASLNISKIVTKLDALFPGEKDMIEYLESMELTLTNLSQGISKNLGARVAESIGENTKNIFNRFNKDFNQGISSLGNDISSKLGVILNNIFNEEFIQEFKNVQESLKDINSSFSKTNRAVNKLLSEIPKYTQDFEELNKVSIEIFETSEKATKNYNLFLNEVVKIEKVMEDLSNFKESINEMLNYSQGYIMQNSEEIKKMTVQVANEYEKISNDIKNIIIETKTTTNDLLDKNKSALENNIFNMESKNREIEQNMSEMSAKLSSATDTLKENLKTVKVIAKNSSDLILENYEKISKTQNEFVTKTNEALKIYDDTFSKINTETMNIVSNIKDMERK